MIFQKGGEQAGAEAVGQHPQNAGVGVQDAAVIRILLGAADQIGGNEGADLLPQLLQLLRSGIALVPGDDLDHRRAVVMEPGQLDFQHHLLNESFQSGVGEEGAAVGDAQLFKGGDQGAVLANHHVDGLVIPHPGNLLQNVAFHPSLAADAVLAHPALGLLDEAGVVVDGKIVVDRASIAPGDEEVDDDPAEIRPLLGKGQSQQIPVQGVRGHLKGSQGLCDIGHRQLNGVFCAHTADEAAIKLVDVVLVNLRNLVKILVFQNLGLTGQIQAAQGFHGEGVKVMTGYKQNANGHGITSQGTIPQTIP